MYTATKVLNDHNNVPDEPIHLQKDLNVPLKYQSQVLRKINTGQSFKMKLHGQFAGEVEINIAKMNVISLPLFKWF